MAVVHAVDALFTEILELLYERPDQRRKRIAQVEKAIEALKHEPPEEPG